MRTNRFCGSALSASTPWRSSKLENATFGVAQDSAEFFRGAFGVLGMLFCDGGNE